MLAIRCCDRLISRLQASQLNHTGLLGVADAYVEAVLQRQQPDGWLGPRNLSDPGTLSPWPRYRMLTALAEYASVQGL